MPPQPKSLWQRHRLSLVTTSLCCERSTYEHSKSAEEVLEDGDGMAVNATLARDQAPRPVPALLAPVSNIVAVPKELNVRPRSPARPRAASWRTPADDVAALVAAKLSEAASAAAAAAMQPIASAATTLSGSLSFVSSTVGASLPFQQAPPALPPGAAAAATAVAVLAPLPAAGPPPKACPSEWFVCDDEEQAVRYFVIQGSDSLEHWITNLTFDPVPFEEAGLGVKVPTCAALPGRPPAVPARLRCLPTRLPQPGASSAGRR
jgi:hypothetical protein